MIRAARLRGVRWATAGLGAIAALLLGAWWCVNSFTVQMNNSIILRQYADELRRQRQRDGRYPESFKGLDYWQRPVYYKADEDRFVLVSYGKDGRPDTEYEHWLTNPPNGRKDVCLFPNDDTVFLDTGSSRACSK